MPKFKVVVCGHTGGIKENNLSGYLISSYNQDSYLALDAGSLLGGIEKAFEARHLNKDLAPNPKYEPPLSFLRDNVKGYFISHPHLDHILALVINSQSDSRKTIYAMDKTIDALRDYIFNGVIWPNFGNEGINPIGIYTYKRLQKGESTSIAGSDLKLEIFPIAHDPSSQSSAILIENRGDSILYCGDVHGGSNHLDVVWKKVAPLIDAGRFHGIFLECSYPASEGGPGGKFHLDVKTFLDEIEKLAKVTKKPLKGLPVIVAHMKEAMEKPYDVVAKIKEQLIKGNTHQVNLIFPKQGELLVL